MQPIIYISNILLAIILAMIINYFVIIIYSKESKPSNKEISENIDITFNFNNPNAEFTHQTKEHSTQSNSRYSDDGSR